MSTYRTDQVAVDGGSFDLHVWVPDRGSGPGLLLLQEIFGVGPYIRAVAERLAELGYVVGARAGRGRYRQIASVAERAADTLERFATGGGQAGEGAGRSASPSARHRSAASAGDDRAEDDQRFDGDLDEGASATRGSAHHRNGDDLLDFDRLLTRGRPFEQPQRR